LKLETRNLKLQIPPGAPGWVLLEGEVGPRHALCFTSLRLRRRSGEVEEVPLATTRDGRIAQLIELPSDIDDVTWRAPDHGQFASTRIAARRAGWIERTAHMAVRVIRTWLRLAPDLRREGGLSLLSFLRDPAATYRREVAFRCRYPLVHQREAPELRATDPLLGYPDWIQRYDTLRQQDVSAIRSHIARFAARPRFHLLVSGNGDDAAAAATLASLRAQLYDNFDYTVIDPSAPLSPEGGSQRANGNLATLSSLFSPLPDSDWIMLLRAGDTLPPHALYWFACEALAQPEATIIYSDDDAVDDTGQRARPRFKPDWSPALLHATHYIGAAAIFRTSTVAKAGGANPGDCRHGNYDLLLRVVNTAGEHVSHIPAVLLHRREPSLQSQAASHQSQDEAWESAQWCADALRAHFERNHVAAEVEQTAPGLRRVRYRLPDAPPMVSIVIPTRDAFALVRQCVDSVLEKTTYPNYEILIVDNQSRDAETLAWFEMIAAHPAVRVLRYDRPFNFSAINNFAVQGARGEVLCLLNNDIEVISPDWLEEMVGHLLRKQAGVVGAKLFYPYGRVQHAGVAVGPGGCADHLHTHLWRDEPGYCNRAVLAQELSAVTGACLLTWKDLYLRLQGLNETDLPVAFNDIDYCLRAQEAGCRVIFTPHAQLAHHESASRGSDAPLAKRLRARREVAYMRARWSQRLRCDPYYNPNLSYWRPDFSLGETRRVKKPWLPE
jgi:GT2 family glycosyltransferase